MRVSITKPITVVIFGVAVLMAQTPDRGAGNVSSMTDNQHMTEHKGHDSASSSMEHKDHEMMATKADKSVNELTQQSTCPVMGGAINKSLYSDHDGKRVYFCCGGCQTSFKKDPEKYLEKLEAMGQAAEQMNTEKGAVNSDKHNSMPKMKGAADDHDEHHAGKRLQTH